MINKLTFTHNAVGQDDYASEEEDEVEQIEQAIRNKGKKKKVGRRGQWPESFVDDLVDIILEDDKFKEKLLMTNVKNVKNSQYYLKVIEEMKKRCSERGEEYTFSVTQTRQKFKRCITLCRDAVMKIKTASGIKRFQEEKEFGAWFGKLLPVISSMDNCQPGQSIEPGVGTAATDITSSSPTNESNQEESQPNGTPLRRKKRSYIPTPSTSKKQVKLDTLLGEIKETVASLKSSMTDANSSTEILGFLKEESKRQAERDTEFLKLMGTLLQTQQQNTTDTVSPHFQAYAQTAPFTNPLPNFYQNHDHNQYRYGMTMSTLQRPEPNEIEPARSRSLERDISYTDQMRDNDYP